MKNIKLMVLVTLGLQISLVYSAQEFKVDIEQDRQDIINQAVIDYPHLVEGFDLVRENYVPVVVKFQDFLEYNLAKNDEEANFGEVIEEAMDVIHDIHKKRFLEILANMSREVGVSIDKIDDRKFQYVIAHKDNHMFNIFSVWMSKWYYSEMYSGCMLKKAIENHNIDLAKMILEASIRVESFMGSNDFKIDTNMQNYMLNFRETPLMKASQSRDHKKELLFLIDVGADVNCRDSYGYSSLQRAICYGCFINAELLIDAGADPNIQDENGLTALHYAVCAGHKKTVMLLIAADKNIIKIQDNVGNTALHLAVTKNDEDLVRILLDAGSDQQILNKSLATAEDLITSQRMKYIFIFTPVREVVSTIIDKIIRCYSL